MAFLNPDPKLLDAILRLRRGQPQEFKVLEMALIAERDESSFRALRADDEAVLRRGQGAWQALIGITNTLANAETIKAKMESK